MSTPPKIKRALNGLLREPGNSVCADCKNSSHPRWAAWSLGVFICIKCAGVHRSLGTHISKVKSVDLDIWQEEHLVNLVKMRSNSEANRIYECRLPAELRRPILDTSRLQNFIRNKYENRKWMGTPETSVGSDLEKSGSETCNNDLVNMDAEDPDQRQERDIHSDHSSVLNLQLLSMPKVKKTVSEGHVPSTLATRRTGIPDRPPERPDLKKSILSLYSKPPQRAVEPLDVTTTSPLSASFAPASEYPTATAANASTSSLEDNELFKNVWS